MLTYGLSPRPGLSARYLVDHLPHQPERRSGGRPADHARGCEMVVRATESRSTPTIQQYARDVSKVEAAPGEVTFFFDHQQSRAARHPRPAHQSCRSIGGRQGCQWQAAQHRRLDDGAADGFGPLQDEGTIAAGSSITYERDPNYWAANEPIGIGQNNFDLDPLRIFPRSRRGLRRLQGRPVRLVVGKPRRALGQFLRFPGRAGWPRDQGTVPAILCRQRHHGGLHPQPPPRQIQGCARPQGAARSLRFRGASTKHCSTTSISASIPISTACPSASKGLPQGAELDDPQFGEGQGARRRSSPPNIRTRWRAIRTSCARICASRSIYSPKAGYTLNGNQRVDAGGHAFTFEILLNGPTIEPVATAWQTNLRSIGIEATIRTVDSAGIHQPRPLARFRGDVFGLGAVDVAGQ